jgi:hypothetical protein
VLHQRAAAAHLKAGQAKAGAEPAVGQKRLKNTFTAHPLRLHLVSHRCSHTGKEGRPRAAAAHQTNPLHSTCFTPPSVSRLEPQRCGIQSSHRQRWLPKFTQWRAAARWRTIRRCVRPWRSSTACLSIREAAIHQSLATIKSMYSFTLAPQPLNDRLHRVHRSCAKVVGRKAGLSARFTLTHSRRGPGARLIYSLVTGVGISSATLLIGYILI